MEPKKAGDQPDNGTPSTDMTVESRQANTQDRLDSWKEIASFIGRDERTAMRWAAGEQGMPVHRIPSGKRGRVYGSRAEISTWLARQLAAPLPDASPVPIGPANVQPVAAAGEHGGGVSRIIRTKYWMAAALLLTVILITLGLLTIHLSRPRLPARVNFTENALQALDDEGHTLWTHTFSQRFDDTLVRNAKAGLAYFVRVVDLMGNGDREVLIVAPFRSGPNPVDRVRTEVDCFSSRGALLWSYIPDNVFQFGDHELTGPWNIFDVMVSHDGSPRSIWVVAIHATWGNSFVVELDPATGRGRLRFVNTGSLYILNELRTSRGTLLLAGGFNNEWQGGSLAVIDEAKPFAASPQTVGTRHKCLSCPEGDPDSYFVFPRSEINVLRREWLDAVRDIDVSGGEVQLSRIEIDQQKDVRTYYRLRLEPAVKAVSVRYSSGYDFEHRELEGTHQIIHPLDKCPERLHPLPVRMWTRSAGWKELNPPPVE
jgi:hypothetical protein